MPYDDSPPPPESTAAVSPDRPRLLRRPALTIALASLLPAALAGWTLLNAVNGPDDDKPARVLPLAGQTSPSPTPHPSDSSTPTPSASMEPSPTPSGSTTPSRAGSHLPLTGRTVVIDPGHNPGNFQHTREINQLVDIGTNKKECDTTGTTTNAGYKEAEFTLDVSRRLRTVLEEQGAKVVLTHQADRAWGPCIDERARIGNEAEADAVVSIHADGVAAGNRGFHIILPALVKGGDADTAAIVDPSRQLGERIAGNFVRTTGSAPSNYVGSGTGLVVRKDLGGLNLSTVPKVFIECGNMRDGRDSALLTNADWRQKAAQGIADGVVGFLGG
ncbi:N-acetylmuramoyl-L-alanine amidase [Streptomyces sp. NPDC006879]|uniref:N-acetylmuramoyl-L-alanine amidase n=1 Tax=Streptomyces sp. NPDC006879 TaxID=3364767 RepID=UPI00368F539F